MTRKLMKTILFSLLLIFIIPSVSFASNYGFQKGDYVDLNGYKFIVLNPETDYLISDFFLENRAFDPNNTTSYNPADVNNIAYYLNNVFLSNLGGISNYIKDNNWAIGNEQNEMSNFVKAKIGMISYSEGKGNLSFIGDPKYNFWTLTPHSSLNISLWMYNTSKKISYSRADSTTISVRPTLYIEEGLSKIGNGTQSNPYMMLTEPVVTLSDIKDLSLLKTTTSEITLKWKNPTETNFSHLNLYQDGNLIETNFINDIYTFTGLNPSKEYTFIIKAVDTEGEETAGISIVVSTDAVPLVPEVEDLNATTKHDRINLSWQNPESEFFHHVRIYRRTDQVHSTPTASKKQSLLEEIIIGKSVSAEETPTETDFDPMFETNGTYWNDLTVEPSTTYDYKLTTENIAGAESEGQIVSATTLAEPLPTIEDTKVDVDENGDYLITWTDTELAETVKIMIDDTLYATAVSSDGSFLVPKDDMATTFTGLKLKLVPVNSSGTEGLSINPLVVGKMGFLTLPFSIDDVVYTAFSLLKLFAPFIVLVLCIYLAPKLLYVIRFAMKKYKEGKVKL